MVSVKASLRLPPSLDDDAVDESGQSVSWQIATESQTRAGTDGLTDWWCRAVDFAKVTSSLGLSRETLSALSSFRSRNAQAKTSLASLKAQKADVDWAHYRGVLKNQEVVDKLEKIWKDFKPQDYDVAAQLKAIEQFESKAVRSGHCRATDSCVLTPAGRSLRPKMQPRACRASSHHSTRL